MESALQSALAYMREHPAELEEEYPVMRSELQAYLKSDGQGTGNKATDHEACIAKILENHWFVRVPRGTIPTVDGVYYWYQCKGSQRSGDFLVFEVKDGVKCSERVLDAKHSNDMSIFLNDGTFETGTIYIVSFTRRDFARQRKKDRKRVCFIGLGEDIYCDEDRIAMDEWRAEVRKLNANKPKSRYLRFYNRSANQYDCDSFTSEFTEDRWSRLTASLVPSL